MSDALLEAEAEQTAGQVISRQRILSLPVCPFDIAKSVGIEVASRDSDTPGVSGFLMRVGNEFGIYYATHIRNDGFIRFSVAHELGHYFLAGHPEALFPNGDGLHKSRSGFISANSHERQADFFAASLLMPEDLFRQVMGDAGSGFAAIERLKETCNTSITATAIRYAKFTDDPVAVIVSSKGYVNWCFLSNALSEVPGVRRLAKGSPLPSGSCTAQFNRVAGNVSGGAKDAAWASLDDWFDDAPQIEMKEDVIGLGGYGKTLTVLFTEEAIEYDEGEDDD